MTSHKTRHPANDHELTLGARRRVESYSPQTKGFIMWALPRVFSDQIQWWVQDIDDVLKRDDLRAEYEARQFVERQAPSDIETDRSMG